MHVLKFLFNMYNVIKLIKLEVEFMSAFHYVKIK